MTEPEKTAPDAYSLMVQSRPDEGAWYRIEPAPEYSPHIGALVGMMQYARLTTLQAVRGLGVEQLDSVPAGFSNSIGMLLAHIAATDRLYQFLSFEGRDPIAEDIPEYRPFVGAMTFGQQGERVQGRSLQALTDQLAEVRAVTLAALARRDDAWLASRLTLPGFDYPDHHWAWFHVMEDEVSHRGQMRLIRKALAATAG